MKKSSNIRKQGVMKRSLVFICIAAGILASCVKFEIDEQPEQFTSIEGSNEISFVASAENDASGTKTNLDGFSINWVAADTLSSFSARMPPMPQRYPVMRRTRQAPR